MSKFTSKQVDGVWCVVDGDLIVSKCGGRTEARDRTKAMNIKPPAEIATKADEVEVVAADESLAAMPEPELEKIAKAEHAAQRDAKKAGEKLPPAPHLDELHRRHAAGLMRHQNGNSRRSSTPRAPKISVQYFKAGKAIPASQNKLSSMAYYFSRDLDGDKKRIGTAEFVAVIAGLTGIDAAKVPSTSWECTLPNGITIAARVDGDSSPVTVPTSEPRKAQPAKKATAKKAAPAKKAAAKQVTPIPKKRTARGSRKATAAKRQTRKAS